MSGWAASRRPGTLAALATALGRYLIDPVDEAVEGAPDRAPGSPRIAPRAPIVAVCGLAPGCGATTVARGLAAALAARHPARAAAVAADALGGAPPLATPAAARLARALAGDAVARAGGRLCLVRGELAELERALGGTVPLVADAAPEALAPAASVADATVLVASPRVEPALAAIAAQAAARVGPPPTVVLNRAPEDASWSGAADVALPEARAAARLARAGREPAGAFGAALAELADLCCVPTSPDGRRERR